jgi:catechol 2,3-dioxygenase-like lactoylglutathione lyase family enzyme
MRKKGKRLLIDHLTLRVADLESATESLKSALDELRVTQTRISPRLSMWGNFGLAQAQPDRPIAHRTHVAFIAPTPEDVDGFAAAGIGAGLVDAGAPGPRPECADDYYAAFLEDGAGNCFEAVHRDGARPIGSIDHLAIRVADVAISTAFYVAIGRGAGLSIRRQIADRTIFSVASGGAFSVIAGVPSENLHLAFSGSDDDVRNFHADALAAGYRSNGEPGERRQYHDGYYAAFVLDPDGNNIEVVDQHR